LIVVVIIIVVVSVVVNVVLVFILQREREVGGQKFYDLRICVFVYL
jgi:hypothetical protein